MLPLLVSVKLLLLSGACQKSEQPAKNGAAASNNRAQLPIFMPTPSTQFSCPAVFNNTNTLLEYRPLAHPATRHTHRSSRLRDATRRKFVYRFLRRGTIRTAPQAVRF
jgi:hypothetical protein